MIPRLYYGNFGFEHELAAPDRATAAGVLRRIDEELACVWIAVAEPGDAVWTPAPIEPEFPARLAAAGFPPVRWVSDLDAVPRDVRVCPWGWTDSLRRLVAARSWPLHAPPAPAVRAANSRRFSFQLEREWGVGLPGAAEVRSVGELAEALRRLPHGCKAWVIKAEFGMSARERILGRGREPTAQAAGWVQRRVRRGGVVFLEPWVERLEEAGLQFTIPPGGPPVFEGLTPLRSGPGGDYRGSRFDAEGARERHWEAAIHCGHRAAARAAALGYFGPLGLDAMRYRDFDGQIRLRPLQDVNARYTMGRLSLGFRRCLQPGEAGLWLHVRWPTDDPQAGGRWTERLRERLPSAARLIVTSPFSVAGRATGHGTLVLIAPTDAELARAERLVEAAPSEDAQATSISSAGSGNCC